MHNRYIPPLLIAAGFAFACGPRSRAVHTATAAVAPVTMGPPVVSSFGVRVKKEKRVSFALHVTNNSAKNVEVKFPSGKTHDFVVLDSTGREVWRWSKGRMFTQALQNKLLPSRENADYEEQWEPSDLHGSFTAVAVLRSENYPVEQAVRFTLP